MDRYIDYPYASGREPERFAVSFDKESASGCLSVGLVSQGTWNGYKPVTVPDVRMPPCQALIIRDSSRFGHDLPRILAEGGLGRIVGESQITGYRGYTVFEFDKDVLRDMNPALFAEYERSAGFSEKEPVSFERRNIEGVEWHVAVQGEGAAARDIAATAASNVEAPFIVTPEGSSYMLIAPGESPQSYETMHDAVARGNELIRSLPERELDVYVFRPSGREGLYQIGNKEEHAVNAYVSNNAPGFINTEILDVGACIKDPGLTPDCTVFDEEPQRFGHFDGFTDIGECVRHVAGEFFGEDNPEIAFIAPCDHTLETVGDYREVMANAAERSESLGDLAKIAKDRAAEKNAQRSHADKGKNPDLGR